MSKPKLRQVRPSSPFRPLFDSLNRAVMEQSDIRPGTGFGMTGRSITRTSQDWMVALTGAAGIGPAQLKDDGDPGQGRLLGQGVAYEQTIQIDDDGVSIVPAGPDEATEIPCFNYAASSQVEPYTLVVLQKLFGLWVVVWEECVPSDS